jgi:hypothetical protein
MVESSNKNFVSSLWMKVNNSYILSHMLSNYNTIVEITMVQFFAFVKDENAFNNLPSWKVSCKTV